MCVGTVVGSRRRAWFVRVATMLTTAFVCACGGPESERFANREYVDRLASVLGQPLPPHAEETLVAWPARRDVRFAREPESIDAAQFLELHTCDLGALVGARNSQLGKLQAASRELDYQVQLVRRIEECAGFAEQPAWLADLAAARRGDMGQWFWNALFGSDEWAAFVGRASGVGLRHDASALTRFDSHWRSLSDGFDVAAFERDLAALESLPRLGAIRDEWAELRWSLTNVARMLKIHGPRLCINGKPTPKVHRTVTVFQKFYSAHLRVRIGMQVTGARETVDSIGALAAAVGPHPAAAAWLTALQSEWHGTQDAARAHADAWSAFFEQCGVPPAIWMAS